MIAIVFLIERGVLIEVIKKVKIEKMRGYGARNWGVWGFVGDSEGVKVIWGV